MRAERMVAWLTEINFQIIYHERHEPSLRYLPENPHAPQPSPKGVEPEVRGSPLDPY